VKATTHHYRRLIVVALLASATYQPLQVSAEEGDQQALKRDSDIFGGPAVDRQDLAISRAGAEVNLYDIKNDGVVGQNQAYNLSTGSNWVTEGSFSGASGFPTVVQNSGNNVLIQNATIINLQVQ